MRLNLFPFLLHSLQVCFTMVHSHKYFYSDDSPSSSLTELEAKLNERMRIIYSDLSNRMDTIEEAIHQVKNSNEKGEWLERDDKSRLSEGVKDQISVMNSVIDCTRNVENGRKLNQYVSQKEPVWSPWIQGRKTDLSLVRSLPFSALSKLC